VQEEQVVAETSLPDVQVVEAIEPPPAPVEGTPSVRLALPPSLQRVVPAVMERAEPSPPLPAAAEPSAHVEAVRCADNEPPRYPEHERRLGHEGVVVLSVRVSTAGLVTDLAVKTPSPHPALDREAVRAVRRWRFEPAQRHGRPVVSDTDVEIEFRLRPAGL
jgi:protein TonB